MIWIAQAAKEIDLMLGDAVRKNTKIETGFFSGVSIQDIMDIIQKYHDGENQ